MSPQAKTSAPASGAQSLKLQIVLCAVRRWWKVAVPLGLLLAAAAGAAVHFTFVPTYTAEVWLIIRDRKDHLLGGGGGEDPGKFIANQIEMMHSPPIVNPVAAIPAVAATPEIAAALDPVQALKQQVKIYPRGQSEYFVVQFSSTDPHSAALIPNEIAKAYLDVQRRTEGFRASELMKLLDHELGQQQILVEQARAAWYNEYTSAVGISPDLVLASQKTTRVIAESGVEAALLTQLTNAEVECLLVGVSIGYQEKQPPSEPTPSEVEAQVASDPEIKRLAFVRAELASLVEEYRNTASGAAAIKRLRELEQKQKQADDDLAATQATLRAQVRSSLLAESKARHDAELLRLRAKKAELETVVSTIQAKLKGEQVKEEHQAEAQRTVGDKMFKVELLKSDYERLQERLDLLKKRTEAMGLEQRAPSRVEVYEYAAVPLLPDRTAPYQRAALAAAGAFLLPLGLAVGVELLLRRIGSRDQLETGNAIAVVGEITTLPGPERRLVHKTEIATPQAQLFEECIDGLRTYLTLVQSLKGMRVLAVASSISGEGKTTLASQLALSLASAKGEPTLLIDGDIRLPDLHKLFGIGRGPGLVEVLRGEVSATAAIQTTSNDTLHVLAAGRLRSSPHRLMNNGEFADLIEELKDTYRYIVIDTPPVLPASESLIMAQAADATILCVRRDYSRVAQVKEAYSRLQAAGVKTVGAVLNGIPSREYAYHYGSYYYARSRYADDVDEIVENQAG
jgi:capsular exopolysaccharide synthesis family protein